LIGSLQEFAVPVHTSLWGGRGRDEEKHSVVYNSHSAELMKVNKKKDDVFKNKNKILS